VLYPSSDPESLKISLSGHWQSESFFTFDFQIAGTLIFKDDVPAPIPFSGFDFNSV